MHKFENSISDKPNNLANSFYSLGVNDFTPFSAPIFDEKYSTFAIFLTKQNEVRNSDEINEKKNFFVNNKSAPNKVNFCKFELFPISMGGMVNCKFFCKIVYLIKVLEKLIYKHSLKGVMAKGLEEELPYIERAV